jgi:hypothetical protein
MRRLALAGIVAIFAFAGGADERERLFDGMGIRLEKITDSMTDKTSCVMFVDEGPIYLAVTPAKVNVWSASDELLFAFDSKHLIRVGDAPPMTLTYLSKQNGISVADAATAGKVVKALAARTPVKVRYYDWPSHDQHDREIVSPAFAYVWGKAEKACGWKPLGVPAELPQATLHVFESKDEITKGYAKLMVDGNDTLGLQKGFDQYGGGCHITVGVIETVGMQAGQWTNALVDLGGRQRIVVRDETGKTVFDEKVPNSYGVTRTGNQWEPARRAAIAMWEVAPLGTVSIESSFVEKQSSLWGFRELWNWGVDRCGFPAMPTAEAAAVPTEAATPPKKE